MKTTSELEKMREEIAKSQGLECGKDARCYHCKKWGYNRGHVMNSMGESRCSMSKNFTASYQWCKHFSYVGNGK